MTTPISDVDTKLSGPLYELSDVRRYFKRGPAEVRAVDGVDLEILPGEFVAVEGPSGSGKSTLLQLLGGLERVTSGSLTFNGAELARMSDRELTKFRAHDMGFVFQHFNLIPTLTAAENVRAPLAVSNVPRAEHPARAIELLEQVGLGERHEHLPSNLSGGEQQRVAIARALANRPRVILADEPTGNLDTTTTGEIIDLLHQLAADTGVTVIVVTHAEHVAVRARRRLKMRDGRFIDVAA
ncbi:MAG: putative transport system ATP-binding protein [Frankiales bacterium]|jgi:putative ABC transport system ATP-binding protein|nr:putative transport system ATP-binding protein [Frankiales bacterium]